MRRLVQSVRDVDFAVVVGALFEDVVDGVLDVS